jgi:hypothetical protein
VIVDRFCLFTNKTIPRKNGRIPASRPPKGGCTK